MLAGLLDEIPRFFTYYNLKFLLGAAATTILLSAGGCILGASLGFFLAIIRVTRSRVLLPARLAAISYIEFFRRVPFLVTLMTMFFVFQFLGFDVSLFTIALTTVCLIAISYCGEIVRAGLESVKKTQWEAAEVMNFTLGQNILMVILPQAWKVILPPIFIFFVGFIKDTALASYIGVVELTYVGKALNNKGFSAGLVFGTVLVFYFIISYPLARTGAWLEKKLGVSKNRTV
jgi:polar amino acid transport system permease protein